MNLYDGVSAPYFGVKTSVVLLKLAELSPVLGLRLTTLMWVFSECLVISSVICTIGWADSWWLLKCSHMII